MPPTVIPFPDLDAEPVPNSAWTSRMCGSRDLRGLTRVTSIAEERARACQIGGEAAGDGRAGRVMRRCIETGAVDGDRRVRPA